jgi:hypothetical protein
MAQSLRIFFVSVCATDRDGLEWRLFFEVLDKAATRLDAEPGFRRADCVAF